MNQLKIFYPLFTWADNPVLKKKSKKIVRFDDEIQEFAETLVALMYAYDGVGLAASQIGNNIQMIAVTEHKNNKRGEILRAYVLVNPEIIEKSPTTVLWEEACLSLPGMTGKVKRYQRIKVRFFDPWGKQHIKKVSGFNARIIQHELDHLEGVLFVEKVVKK